MKALQLIKYGDAKQAFQLKEIEIPRLKDKDDLLIEVDAFGINFADVMARRGLYRAAPPLPAILGYEVVGKVVKTKDPKNEHWIGKRVVAMTRFGGYAQFAVSSILGIQEAPQEITNGSALALATQYCTAYYAMMMEMNLNEADQVLIHAASGGVGTALTQLAKLKGCKVIGLTRSKQKVDYLIQNGVDIPIVTTQENYSEIIKKLTNPKIDAIFNPVGGKTVQADLKLLASGGKLVFFGISDRMNKRKGLIQTLLQLFKIGRVHPAMLLLNSQAILGVNLLKIAEDKPERLSVALNRLVDLALQNKIQPIAKHVFNFKDIHLAHDGLENGKFIGKTYITWGGAS